MEMRWYAEVGAHALTTHRASNSVLFPEYAKLVVFCFEVGVFPTVALLQMTWCQYDSGCSPRRFSLAQSHQRKLEHSPSTSRQDPRENMSKSEKPSGKGYDETILEPIQLKRAAVRLFTPPILHDCASVMDGRSPLLKGYFT